MEGIALAQLGIAERPGGVEKEQVKLPAIVGQPEVPDPVVWKGQMCIRTLVPPHVVPSATE